jgi:hypothetical protein
VGVYSRIVEATLGHETPAEPEKPAPGPADLEGVVVDVGGRIQEIVDAAERVGALTESLGFRIESLQREAQALVDVLDQARRSLGDLAEVEAARSSGRATPDLAPAPEPAPEPAPQPQPPRSLPVPDVKPEPSPQRIPDQAVLRATQMAVAGTERTEIEQMLRDEFGVADATGVVDRMLRADRP